MLSLVGGSPKDSIKYNKKQDFYYGIKYSKKYSKKYHI